MSDVGEDRLEMIAADLSAQLRDCSDAGRRAAALAACRLALNRNPLDEPVIAEALAVLEAGGPAGSTLKASLWRLVEHLDADYFDLQDAADEGRSSQADFFGAFRKARAVNALYCALSRGSFEAATESIYEANAAVENLEALRVVIQDALLGA